MYHYFLNDNEQATLINNLNDSLIIENIYDQLGNVDVEDHPIDYLTTFNNRIYFLEYRYKDNDDLKEKITEVKSNFYRMLLKKMCDKYYLKMSNEDLNLQQIIDIVTVFYRFFILQYKDNLVNFLFNYIRENKKSLAAAFGGRKSKDADIQELKKTYKNKYDIIILYNMYDVIIGLPGDEISASDIIKYITEDHLDEMDNIFMYNLFVKQEYFGASQEFKNVFLKVIAKRDVGYMKIIREVETLLFDALPKRAVFDNIAEGEDE
jgi:hypothetical protein